MRKIIIVIIMTAVLLLIGTTAFAENSWKVNFDDEAIKHGYLKISCTSNSGQAIKIMIEREDKKYIYSLRTDGISENFPLQMGNGDYSISVLQSTGGNNYNIIEKRIVNLNVSDSNIVFLNSIQNINWDNSMKAIIKADEITKNLKGENEKIESIYNYVVSNFKYDYDKLNNLPDEYIPDIENTISEGKGICYDYSSLFASMLRSCNIPVKLVKGYTKNAKGYHAWNEVYISSTGKWVTIDTTYDLQMKAAKIKYSMIKDEKQYTPVNIY